MASISWLRPTERGAPRPAAAPARWATPCSSSRACDSCCNAPLSLLLPLIACEEEASGKLLGALQKEAYRQTKLRNNREEEGVGEDSRNDWERWDLAIFEARKREAAFFSGRPNPLSSPPAHLEHAQPSHQHRAERQEGLQAQGLLQQGGGGGCLQGLDQALQPRIQVLEVTWEGR
jgi:hypothetical protein